MIESNKAHDTRKRAFAQVQRMRLWAMRRPLAALALLLGDGMLCGAAVRSAIGMAQVEAMQSADAERQAELDKVRRDAQREVNALAARLAELQALAQELQALRARCDGHDAHCHVIEALHARAEAEGALAPRPPAAPRHV